MIHNPTLTHIPLEQNQPLSQSLLWELQRNFFAQQGINAWNHNTVPHYITSNPYIANAYAKVTLGFLRDWQPSLDPTHPIYILELGAGSGRFAYHFLKKFWAFFPHTSLNYLTVKYILSDFSPSNLHYWHHHPFLQTYFQQGKLDIAQFDAQNSQSLHLQHANQTHTTLKNPLIVLANYFFDCLPQDAFTLKQNQLYASLVNLTLPNHRTPNLEDPDLVHHLQITYSDRPITPNYYGNPAYNQLLHHYQQHLNNTTVLLPIVGLKCLDNLRQLSQNRLLLISGDKGYSKLEDLGDRPKPHMAFHGSCFSLMVNYHAIGQYVINQGGQALDTPHRHASLNISAFMFGHPPTEYAETRHGYSDAIINNSPDDFFHLKKAMESQWDSFAAAWGADRLTLQQLIAYLRLSGWDANIFLNCLSSLNKLIETTNQTQRQELIQIIENIWDTYYPIGETQDLPFQLGKLLLKLQDYSQASYYFQQSLKLHGLQAKTLQHLGQCYRHLNQHDAAMYCLDQSLNLP
ncbi:tetratricopeptide repeat protein [Anabaenopsis sp. FSS-46]|uniref:tetratricopeptide repeat protein n=1 Tax=Anabaenopsis sp. FSS-46 TaxID=2971766 RepID=UPI002477026F|nr:tetratricopeptide repeat protein [Anabaenopsis sp. FSS-46]MDH6097501.1 tetratricopeptide repeat protein [Anabaenopsis sp. FSS-46]